MRLFILHNLQLEIINFLYKNYPNAKSCRNYMEPLDVEIFQKSYWIQNCDRLKYCADSLIEKLLLIKDEEF